MEFIGYLALIGIGIILSIAGGGGSLLSIPILVYLFSLDIITASSYSLFIVGTTSLLGVWLKQKEHRIDLQSGFIFCASSVIAIFSTRKWLMYRIPEKIMLDDHLLISKRALILAMFALLAITASLIMLMKKNWPTREQGEQKLAFLLPVGFATGILAGFVGVGGGFLILPALLIFARLPFKIAIGTALLVIGFNSLLGFLGDFMTHPIDWSFLLAITGMAAVGMLLGNYYEKKMPAHYMRLSFGWLLLVCALTILVKELLWS